MRYTFQLLIYIKAESRNTYGSRKVTTQKNEADSGDLEGPGFSLPADKPQDKMAKWPQSYEFSNESRYFSEAI